MTWQLDRAQSSVEFAIGHFIVDTVHGRFADFDADLSLDQSAPERSWVRAAIHVDSVVTGNDERDQRLRSRDFFDAEHYPQMTFTSNDVVFFGKELWVRGDLTIQQTTAEVVLDGGITGPWTGDDGQSHLEVILVIRLDPRQFLLEAAPELDFFVGHSASITITARLVDAPGT